MLGRPRIVERHREPALTLPAEPLLRYLLELGKQRGVQLASAQDHHAVAIALKPVDRLPYLAHRAPVERELLGVDDRLVTEVRGG